MRLHYWSPPADLDINKVEDACIREIMSKEEKLNTGLRDAKRLLKLYGGRAWTEHYERDGTMFEVTEITLDGNNWRHKYNRHL